MSIKKFSAAGLIAPAFALVILASNVTDTASNSADTELGYSTTSVDLFANILINTSFDGNNAAADINN